MVRAIHLVFSMTFLLSKLADASPMQFYQNTESQISNSEKLSSQILNNDVDEYGLESKVEVKRESSRVCAHYSPSDPCHKTNEGCPKYERCSTEYRSACYTLWKGNEVLLQGCWFPSSQNCKRQCVGKNVYLLFSNPVYHCCCFGDFCNEEYSVPNAIPARR